MTLMPVTRISAAPACSAKLGASRWIGAIWVWAMGPASSIGSPITFMMRPNVAGPTGTRIGVPVSITSWPRVRPSVVSMAMARTAFSPRCWATSNTSRTSLPVLASMFLVSSAFRIAGSSPFSNETSTTAPITWRSLPLALFLVLIVSLFLNGGGAGDDFNQLLGDLRLAGTVHLDGEGFYHGARIAGGIVHRGHLRGEEASLVLQHRGQNLYRDILRQQRLQDGVFIRLVIVERRGPAGGFHLGGDQLLYARRLGDHRLERTIDQRHDVELAIAV